MTSCRTLLAALLCCCLAGAAHAQDASPVRVRGTIDAVNAQSLQVTARDGQKITLALAPSAVITAVVAANIADIKPGSYIGTAAIPQADGSLVALEIQLFPESMRGVSEGQHPWDLQPNSTMTNGTVGDVVVTEGRTLTLHYKDGEKRLTVPEKAPIITYAPGTAAMLTPGAHVIITAVRQPDGALVAQRIGVGKNGLVPPM